MKIEIFEKGEKVAEVEAQEFFTLPEKDMATFVAIQMILGRDMRIEGEPY